MKKTNEPLLHIVAPSSTQESDLQHAGLAPTREMSQIGKDSRPPLPSPVERRQHTSQVLTPLGYSVDTVNPDTPVSEIIGLLKMRVDEKRHSMEEFTRDTLTRNGAKVQGKSIKAGNYSIVFRVDDRAPLDLITYGFGPSGKFLRFSNMLDTFATIGSASLSANNNIFDEWGTDNARTTGKTTYQYAIVTEGKDVASALDNDLGETYEDSNYDEAHFPYVTPERIYLLDSSDLDEQKLIADIVTSDHVSTPYGVPLQAFIDYQAGDLDINSPNNPFAEDRFALPGEEEGNESGSSVLSGDSSHSGQGVPAVSGRTREWVEAHVLSLQPPPSVLGKGEENQYHPLDAGTEGMSEIKRDDVDVWSQVKVNSDSESDSKPSHFDGQIILQLEDEPVVMKAAAKLAGKHSAHSVLVQLDSQGKYRVVYGDPHILQEKTNLRWQVVGHGSDEGDTNRLAGYSATELAEKIAALCILLDTEYSVNSKPQHLSLVACSMATRIDYAKQLALSLKEKQIHTAISARRVQVVVTDNGNKLTQHSTGNWGHKISENKLILRWNSMGELVEETGGSHPDGDQDRPGVAKSMSINPDILKTNTLGREAIQGNENTAIRFTPAPGRPSVIQHTSGQRPSVIQHTSAIGQSPQLKPAGPPAKKARVAAPETSREQPSTSTISGIQYGLSGSEYEPYVSTDSTWHENDPAYPVSGRDPQGKRSREFWNTAKSLLNDASKTNEEKAGALSRQGIQLNLHGLEFFRMPGHVATELTNYNGKLIADVVNHRVGGEPVIRRVIEPMSGSGTYSNWIRALGFKGEMILNDVNPWLVRAQKAIVEDPEQVLQAIEEIKSDILAIGKRHGINFNEKLIIKFDDLFPELRHIALDENVKTQKLIEFSKKGKGSAFRKNLHEYFYEKMNSFASIENKKVVFNEPAAAVHHQDGTITTLQELKSHFNANFAALFYIMQNASNHGDTVRIRNLPALGEETIHLPLSILTRDKHRYLQVFNTRVNDKKLNFISHIHANKARPTEFLHGDGWELFKRDDIGPGDLIILSGHFSDKYLSEAEFAQKIDEYVIPATEKGAKVLIMNAFSEGKESLLQQRGFQVYSHDKSQSRRVARPRGARLVALKNIDTAANELTPENPLPRVLGDFLLHVNDLEQRHGVIPGLTRAKINSDEHYHEEGYFPLSDTPDLKRDNVNSWSQLTVNTDNPGEASRFDGQIILQLEDESVVMNAAARLAGKHPAHSVLVQLDAEGMPRVVYGDPSILQGKTNLRWQVVGHGSNKDGINRLAGYSATELAEKIAALRTLLSTEYNVNSKPQHVSLVACLMATETDYAKQLALSLDAQHIRTDISARRVQVAVNNRGQKLTQDSNNNWQHKISEDKLILRWDKNSGKLVSTAVQISGWDIGDSDQKISQLSEKNQLLTSLHQAEALYPAMAGFYRKNQLSPKEWLPVFSSLQPGDTSNDLSQGNRVYTIEFIHQTDPFQARRKFTIDDRRIVDFIQHYNEQLAKAGKQYHIAGGERISLPDVTDVEGVDGLNAGILVKMLIPWFASKSCTAVAGDEMPGTLNTALQVHTYVGLAQMAHSTAEDIAKITTLYRSAVAISQGNTLTSKMSPLAHLGKGLGTLFNLGNVVLDSIELSRAQNEAQRAVFGTQLAFDSASLATTAFSWFAGATSTAGACAGVLTVPLAGLGIGFTALAEAFSAVTAKAQAVGDYFADLDEAYKQGGYRQVTRTLADGSRYSVMEPIPGAVIKILDLKNRQLTLGSQYIYRNDPEYSVGSSKSNYFFYWPARELNSNKNEAINIREGIGYSEAQHSFIPGDGPLILPTTAVSYIRYEYMALPFCTLRRDRGFDVLRRLEQDGRFDYDFYAFPSERIIHKITHEIKATAVNVILDGQNRDIIVPQLPDVIKGKLSYQFAGDGGEYRISLQPGVSLSLQSGNSATRWVMDGRQLGADEVVIHGNQLQVGGVQITLSAEPCGTISVINNKNEIFTLDRDRQDKTLQETDGSRFTDWQALHQNLRLLTSHSDPGNHNPFVTVENYQPPATGRNVGRAFYQVSTDRFIYTSKPEASQYLSTAQLARIDGNKAWFYRGTDVWLVDIATGEVLRQYLPIQLLGNDTRVIQSRVWQDNNQLYLAFEQQYAGNNVHYIYQIEEVALKLVRVSGDTALMNELKDLAGDEFSPVFPQSAGVQYAYSLEDGRPGEQVDGLKKRDGEHLSHLSARLTPHQWLNPVQALTSTTRQVKGTLAASISLSGEEKTSEGYWLFSDGQEIKGCVKANLGEAALPSDLVLAFVTRNDKPGYYFFSREKGCVYFQADNGLSGTQATRVPLSGVKSVIPCDQQYFVLTNEGTVWLLNDGGKGKLVGVALEWLHHHRKNLTTQLDLLATQNDNKFDNLLLWGMQDRTGKVLSSWYDSVASRVIQGGPDLNADHRLTYLGLSHDNSHAWIFDADSQTLYRQPQAENAVLTLSQSLVPDDLPGNAEVWQPQASGQKYVSAVRVGNNLRLETTDGAVALLSITAKLADKPVLIALRVNARQDAQVASLIEAMMPHYASPPVIRLLVQSGQAPGWYLAHEKKILRASGVNAEHVLHYLGKVAGQKASYIHDQTTGELWVVGDQQTTCVGNYSFIHQDQGNLVLELNQQTSATELGEVVLPQLQGADSLIISTLPTSRNRYRFDGSLLSHYQQIVMDERGVDSIIRLEPGEAGFSLQRSGKALILYDNLSGSSIRLNDVDSAAQRGLKLAITGTTPLALSLLLKEMARQTALNDDDSPLRLMSDQGQFQLLNDTGQTLFGGHDDDDYQFARGDGHNTIMESGGHDTLDFTSVDITKDRIGLRKQGDDLTLFIDGENAGDSVTVKDYYAQPQNKLEVIQAGGYRLVGDNIDNLAQAMTAFPAEGGVTSPLRNEHLVQSVNQYWVAVTNLAG